MERSVYRLLPPPPPPRGLEELLPPERPSLPPPQGLLSEPPKLELRLELVFIFVLPCTLSGRASYTLLELPLLRGLLLALPVLSRPLLNAGLFAEPELFGSTAPFLPPLRGEMPWVLSPLLIMELRP